MFNFLPSPPPPPKKSHDPLLHVIFSTELLFGAGAHTARCYVILNLTWGSTVPRPLPSVRGFTYTN